MQIKTLGGIPVAVIAQTFNDAFSDYLVPIQLTEQALADKMRSENTAPEYSAGVFDGDKLVGFILIGIDNGIAYNGGTGVIPNYRGHNLTRQMYDFLLPLLAQKGIRKHLLEVITENVRAVPVYRKIGFETIRTVSCFKGKIENSRQPEVAVKEIDLHEIRTEFCDFTPTFQNTIEAILRTREQHKALGAFDQDNLIGFIVFAPNIARVKHFGVDKSRRLRSIGKRLFQEVQSIVGDTALSLTNVDDRTGSIAFLEKIGLEKTVSQFEMQLEN